MSTLKVAQLKSWKKHHSQTNLKIDAPPIMIEGFIFDDPLEINNDGDYVKITNIQKEFTEPDRFIIHTNSCVYRLMKNEETP